MAGFKSDKFIVQVKSSNLVLSNNLNAIENKQRIPKGILQIITFQCNYYIT